MEQNEDNTRRDMGDGGEEKDTDCWGTRENHHHEDCLPSVSDGQGAGQRQRNKEEIGEPWGCGLRKPREHRFSQIKERETVLDGAVSNK